MAASVVIIGAVVPVAASAEPATVETDTYTDTFVFETPVLLCSPGPLYSITYTATFVDHVVRNKSGEGLHVSSKVTASFTAIPVNDPTLPTATGTLKSHDAFQRDRVGAATSTSAGVRRVTFSDGTDVTEHAVFHFTIAPDGRLVLSSEKCAARP